MALGKQGALNGWVYAYAKHRRRARDESLDGPDHGVVWYCMNLLNPVIQTALLSYIYSIIHATHSNIFLAHTFNAPCFPRAT